MKILLPAVILSEAKDLAVSRSHEDVVSRRTTRKSFATLRTTGDAR